MLLTDVIIRNAKPKDKPYKLVDGQGMHLLIKPNGSKYWQLRYRFIGKEKLLALGIYPQISLAEAREKRYQARKSLVDNVDPSQVKKDKKRILVLNNENSFANVAREWHEIKKEIWTPRHTDRTLRRLEADVFPTLGHRPINEITAPELLSVLRTIEKRGALDIVSRILQTCGQIFRYAISTGRAKHNISVDLRGAIKT